MRIPIAVSSFRKKTKNFFRGGGSIALSDQTPVLNGRLLLDELVEQPAENQPTDHEPREPECGSVLRPRDSDGRGRHAMMAQEVNQDAQCCTRCQDDNQCLAHCCVRLSCFRCRSFVNGSRPLVPTGLCAFPCLCVAPCLLVLASVALSAFGPS